ncbi:EXOSC3 (predicted) [Pycnogonum litorale]
MADLIGKIVIPGDCLEELSKKDLSDKIILGPGLQRESESVIATKCGIVKCREANIYWIDNHQKRYVPVRGDCIIGIVTNKMGDYFSVDIGSSQAASLSYLAFEGATKRNRPNVQIGDLIYAKLLTASKDMEPEMVCVDSHGKKSGLGILDPGGFMITVPLNLVYKILSKECVLIKNLGKSLSFEISVGMNGRIYIKSKLIKNAVGIINAILLSEYMTNDEINVMCNSIIDSLAGF